MIETTTPTPVSSMRLLGDIEQAIITAYESGYIGGHNDTVEGCYLNDSHFVAKDRATEIVASIAARLKNEQVCEACETYRKSWMEKLKEADKFRAALEQIRDIDYRGNKHESHYIAKNAMSPNK